MSRATYLIALAVVVALAATAEPGALLAAAVALVAVSTIHALTTSASNPRRIH